MVNFDRAFVLVGLAWLIIGMILGFYIAFTTSTQFIPVHVAMMLSGFVVLTVYGLIYRGWPALNETTLGHVQFWIAAIAVVGQVVGALQFVLSGSIAVVAAASALALLSALILAWLVLTHSAA